MALRSFPTCYPAESTAEGWHIDGRLRVAVDGDGGSFKMPRTVERSNVVCLTRLCSFSPLVLWTALACMPDTQITPQCFSSSEA